jgi:hypothetical protein
LVPQSQRRRKWEAGQVVPPPLIPLSGKIRLA